MIIKKKSGTFNTYACELSWGQLNALYKALERDHADPLADEAYAELGWYLQNVPGPGEDEDEYKEAKEAEKQTIENGGEAVSPDEELVGQELKSPPAEESGTEEQADDLLERPPEEESPEPAFA